LNVGWRILEPEQVVFGVGAVLRLLALIPLALVREYRSVPLRKALAYSMARLIGWRFKGGKRD
ncbi:MAG: hypothetical protein PHY98_07750, partial [Candidatus Cloacimonetes bacterium]|nr:hypothetical protein [Candidatus Cloacimonadota bacterium]